MRQIFIQTTNQLSSWTLLLVMLLIIQRTVEWEDSNTPLIRVETGDSHPFTLGVKNSPKQMV